jgi:hypothetical protein
LQHSCLLVDGSHKMRLVEDRWRSRRYKLPFQLQVEPFA